MSTGGFTWKGGGLGSLIEELQFAQLSAKFAAAEALEETMNESAEDMRTTMLEATTWTGDQRAAATGGHPGRYDTGRMHDAVGARVDHGERLLAGSFGWIDGYQHYFLEQEYGKELVPGSKVPPMMALWSANSRAQETIKRKLAEAGFEVNG